MRPLATVVLILICCPFAASDCVEVKGPETKPSSQNARITVLLDGKPRGNVKFTLTMLTRGSIITSNGRPQGNAKATDALPKMEEARSLITDPNGTVVLKDLPVGINCIEATDENYFRADLCLAVSKQVKNEVSLFTLNLASTLPPAPLSNVQAAAKDAAPERLRQLMGVVIDPAGAAVSHADIRVYKRGSYSEDPVAKAWTDLEGRFTIPLNPDTYVVLIRMPAFKAALRVIEISREGPDADLREVLQLGGCSESVVVFVTP